MNAPIFDDRPRADNPRTSHALQRYVSALAAAAELQRDPEVPLERARARHEFARNLLAHGLDPSALKAAIGKDIFIVTMREWEKARGHMSALPLLQSRVKPLIHDRVKQTSGPSCQD
jgi:hypothetical protein